ncbi:uncharacterized protein I303_100828 [Kwoniella dejecticola CBS 10117]|uniref:Uncharacterized protein n=1 Tax=Kwoniella dejecticola CBS 10117 TaxID=1296121 RepID=A0A1A6AG26_9TREE|nr:uncharacterized protein I303_00830 [Kwoniella dejecticola CBS 10117]OBR89009.1 hypothetical protein I303_00830 [Kwoniella dejecticola CBS 10117]
MLNSAGLKESPVPIDAAASDLSLLLDLATTLEARYPSAQEEWLRLFRLCDKYDFYMVRRRLYNRLIDHIRNSPWDVFCIASHLDDTRLAKKAVKKFDNDQSHSELTLNTITLKDASQPTLPYLLGLLQLKKAYGSDGKTWASISKGFKAHTRVRQT